ncbi:hypothetical protein GCM10011374_38590 [Kocuria dechangensis]|uniref:Uncharacterized protein n=1 Tax=Kocuria dechangensis TaxID=1176249 RepID=A0A917H865_9MICC|nr:hypothetical protein GCM10011374_38590 [Kocuria dechangensis]
MDPYEWRKTWFGLRAAGYNFEPSAAGPGSPGIRFTSPGQAGGWLPLEECEPFADALKEAARASSWQYASRARDWAA